jgi:ubiquinone/menaquinone biosynthesis C-methylase UbiE
MRADPLREDYLKFFETQYDAVNYNGRSLASRVLQQGHSLVEKRFGPEAYFDTVLEVGAGHGEHIDSVRHQYRRWIMTDINADELRRRWDTPEARARGIEVGAADAKSLAGYEDNSADRLPGAALRSRLCLAVRPQFRAAA